MKRREFLGGLGLMFGSSTLRAAGMPSAKPNLTVGVLSDIHVKHDVPETAETFRKALEYYRDRACDAVLIAGDLADHGVIEDLQAVADAWFAVFPENRGRDGKPVEKLFIYGNHDWEGWWYGEYPKKRPDCPESAKLYRDYPGAWEKCFREAYAPIYLKRVKGYAFVGAHFDNFIGVKGLEEFLAAHAAELKGPKPFFYFQHMHPKDTVGAPAVWGQDWGISTAALSKYPNAIAFSGHSHTSLTDERMIWQGAFTSVGTSTLSYVGSFGGRENRRVCKGEKQGQLMLVYDDRVELVRRDFVRGEELGTWTIPLPCPGTRPFAFGARAAAERAPSFPSGAKVAVAYENAEKVFRLDLPAARPHGGARVWDYEVEVESREADFARTFLMRRWYSPAFAQAPGREPESVTFRLPLKDLPDGRPFRFRVRPVTCFGTKGAPADSNWLARPSVAWGGSTVIAELRDADQYAWINPNLAKAFAFLRRPDLAKLPVGRYEIDGARCYAMIQEPTNLKRWEQKPLKVEAHRKYIDVQMPIGMEETFGNYALTDEDLKLPFDETKDIVFMDRVTWAYSVRPGEFALFLPPRGGHAPCLELNGAKSIRKVVVKVLAE